MEPKIQNCLENSLLTAPDNYSISVANISWSWLKISYTKSGDNYYYMEKLGAIQVFVNTFKMQVNRKKVSL